MGRALPGDRRALPDDPRAPTVSNRAPNANRRAQNANRRAQIANQRALPGITIIPRARFSLADADTIGPRGIHRFSARITAVHPAAGRSPLQSQRERSAVAAQRLRESDEIGTDPMPRSFYYGTDLDVRTKAMIFANAINASPETYGISVEDAEAYLLLAQAYSAAIQVVVAPGTRTSVTLITKDACRRALVLASMRLAKIINANKSLSDGQKENLGLAVVRAPVPQTSLGAPTKITCHLAQIGTLTLSWKCHHPTRATGVLYLVSRKINDAGEFVPLGYSGKKSFIDSTLPAGASAVTYRVQAARSNAVGEPATYTVNFTTRGMPPDMFKPMGRAIQHAA